MKKFKKLHSKDPVVKQIQNNVEEVINPVVDKAVIDGVLLKKVCLTPLVANLVAHKLGRDPLGWIVVRKRGDSRIWDIQDINKNSKDTLALTCSHEVLVDLWVF